jgi:hypothetical protein
LKSFTLKSIIIPLKYKFSSCLLYKISRLLILLYLKCLKYFF